MHTIVLIIHVLASLGLIGLIMIQQGKGADMGAAFGSGASSTVFGAHGAGNFITRSTAILATVFFVTSLTLAYISGQGAVRKSVTEMIAPAASEQPAAPAVPNGPDLPVAPKAE